jgi:L-amino acid N-acyltransferase YncA
VSALIRVAGQADAAGIADIYNHYIANTVVTFEENAVAAVDIGERIQATARLDLPWLVAGDNGEITGYAYASKWNGRCAYRHTVEIAVYLSPGRTNQGLGSMLYEALFAQLRKQSIHVVIGGIALPNPGSIALHEKFGMKKVGHFEQVGFKFGRWVDVGYWQGMLGE